jgi:hypothetical protein
MHNRVRFDKTYLILLWKNIYEFEEACEILKQRLQDQVYQFDLKLRNQWPDEALPSKMSLDDWKYHLREAT